MLRDSSSRHAWVVHELHAGEVEWDAQRMAISIGTAVELLSCPRSASVADRGSVRQQDLGIVTHSGLDAVDADIQIMTLAPSCARDCGRSSNASNTRTPNAGTIADCTSSLVIQQISRASSVAWVSPPAGRQR